MKTVCTVTETKNNTILNPRIFYDEHQARLVFVQLMEENEVAVTRYDSFGGTIAENLSSTNRYQVVMHTRLDIE